MGPQGAPHPHEDILINVEAFRGCKGNWKLVKIALLPGTTSYSICRKTQASRIMLLISTRTS
jgi:hypothetical protein